MKCKCIVLLNWTQKGPKPEKKKHKGAKNENTVSEKKQSGNCSHQGDKWWMGVWPQQFVILFNFTAPKHSAGHNGFLFSTIMDKKCSFIIMLGPLAPKCWKVCENKERLSDCRQSSNTHPVQKTHSTHMQKDKGMQSHTYIWAYKSKEQLAFSVIDWVSR